jgi:predicted LPLAT superfamily acyltransferase
MSEARREDWRSHQERSTPFMVRLIVWLAKNLPRAAIRPLLYPIVGYFMLTSPTSRAASRDYLRRALAREPAWRDQWRHFFAFASCTLDRIFLLSRRYQSLDVTVDRPGPCAQPWREAGVACCSWRISAAPSHCG